MIRPAVLAVSLALLPGLARAQILESGDWDIVTDGARGTIRTMGDHASIRIGAPGCSGGFTGILERSGDTATLTGEGCTLDLARSADGRITISEGPGCTMWHGASCAFSGSVVGPALAVDIDAIDAAFARLGGAAAMQLQEALRDAGTYDGAIDGQTGPGTRGAIIERARRMAAEGDDVRLDDADFA
ncbi:peptidoglycan-binding domain-containing protein [Wenxinia saemankumensis]|uniref:Peptidoglycan binding domain-containing protein n=1 Tax=Wenxinia saemankumensis TaxID=1447782 RepID=A0A1M6I2F7_9RHOB|nr:peptidoglycan-binding domain-containing protein [Wenxinia saemankumensis]SHJ28647.1 hypothetical protein SAMN05444417_3486 [Wenxinia saemankumensis]